MVLLYLHLWFIHVTLKRLMQALFEHTFPSILRDQIYQLPIRSKVTLTVSDYSVAYNDA